MICPQIPGLQLTAVLGKGLGRGGEGRGKGKGRGALLSQFPHLENGKTTAPRTGQKIPNCKLSLQLSEVGDQGPRGKAT